MHKTIIRGFPINVWLKKFCKEIEARGDNLEKTSKTETCRMTEIIEGIL